MISPKQIQPEITECLQCQRKKSLIGKYLHLINLLKKKNDKPAKIITLQNQFQSSSTNSHTTNSIAPSSLPKHHGKSNNQTLTGKQSESIQVAVLPKDYKLSILIIANKFTRVSLFEGFNAIYKKSRQSFNIDIGQKDNILEIIKNQTNNKAQSNLLLFKNVLKEVLIINSLKDNSKSQNFNLKDIIKSNFKINNQNQNLKKILSQKEKQLSQCLRRQNKENDKKRQSLQMLGQEICQKNELINELQGLVKCYESRITKTQNILEQQYQTLRKDIFRLQKINQRLNCQIQKNIQIKSTFNKKIQDLQNRNVQLSDENKRFRSMIFELKQKQLYYNQAKSQLQKMNKKLQQRIDSIKNQERRVAEKSRTLSKLQTLIKNDDLKNQQIKKVIETINSQTSQTLKSGNWRNQDNMDNELKILSIFMYLKGLKFSQNTLSNKNLFSQSQIKLLQKIGYQNFDVNKSISMIQFKQIKTKTPKTNTLMDSMYEQKQDLIIQNEADSNLNEVLDVLQNPQSKTLSNRNSLKQNFTLKLIQLDLQKKRFIETISELKHKIMHIRSLILNFFRSMQLKALNPEPLSIIQVIFDIFEYSEQQKASIFKKKKTFGLF